MLAGCYLCFWIFTTFTRFMTIRIRDTELSPFSLKPLRKIPIDHLVCQFIDKSKYDRVDKGDQIDRPLARKGQQNARSQGEKEDYQIQR